MHLLLLLHKILRQFSFTLQSILTWFCFVVGGAGCGKLAELMIDADFLLLDVLNLDNFRNASLQELLITKEIAVE